MPNDSSPESATPSAHDAYEALRIPAYSKFLAGRTVYVVGQQMTSVAIGWQVYQLTGSATALGLIGLAQALPVMVLSLPAGHLADTHDRKSIVVICQFLIALAAVGLALVSLESMQVPAWSVLTWFNHLLQHTANLFGESKVQFENPAIPLVFLFIFLSGVARAYESPARSAILSQIVPLKSFGNAVTWSSSSFQMSSMVGPALGGGLIAILTGKSYQFAAVYIAEAACALSFMMLMITIKMLPAKKSNDEISFRALAAGIKFVFQKKVILATLTLDLFAVLLGGATALLPIYADKILHAGPAQLGWLRAAPSIGAFLMAIAIAHLPPMKKAGNTMLWAVAGFGAATIVFGISHNFFLSLLMLALTGAFDNISVVVRHTLVQVLTPNEMRGRVSAVNGIFIGASNELGALESGLTAAAFGPIASVVGGGIGTILVVIAVMTLLPQITRIGALHEAHHEAEAEHAALQKTT